MARLSAAARPTEDDLGVASYFEVHVRREARWTIDCTATTAAEALAEADEIVRRADVGAVKVVNERYNPRNDLSAARIVYKVEKPERKRTRGPVRMVAAPRIANAPPIVAAASSGNGRPGSPASQPDQRPVPPRGYGARTTSPAATWLLFAWASLVLALGASALFVVLLVVG